MVNCQFPDRVSGNWELLLELPPQAAIIAARVRTMVSSTPLQDGANRLDLALFIVHMVAES
jgi:hypothetical protein